MNRKSMVLRTNTWGIETAIAAQKHESFNVIVLNDIISTTASDPTGKSHTTRTRLDTLWAAITSCKGGCICATLWNGTNRVNVEVKGVIPFPLGKGFCGLDDGLLIYLTCCRQEDWHG